MGSLTVSYGGNTIHTSSADETFTLQTSGKYASDDITLTGTDVTSMTITYGGQTIDTGTGSFTHKLLTSGKLISGDIGVSVVMASSAPTQYISIFSVSTFSLSASKGWNGTLYYSTDRLTWNEWSGSSISAAIDPNGDYGSRYYLYICGTGNTVITGATTKRWVFSFTSVSNIFGNIESLLDWQTVEAGNHPSMSANCFYYMFYNVTNANIRLTLPATTLANSCYREMFYGCTRISSLPSLPATTLPSYCYYRMYYGCTGVQLRTAKYSFYKYAYRIPTTGTGTAQSNSMTDMFTNTGGAWAGTPTINTTYYARDPVIS